MWSKIHQVVCCCFGNLAVETVPNKKGERELIG